MTPKRLTYVEINLDNISHNYNLIKNLVNGATDIIAVVKGNSYGHGAIEITRHLLTLGHRFFSVATLNEALELRKNVLDTYDILIMAHIPFNIDDYVADIIDNDLIVTVTNLQDARLLNDATKRLYSNKRKAKCNIKIDSGFHRLGFSSYNPESLREVESLYLLNNLQIKGLFTHMRSTSMQNDLKQLNSFDLFVEKLKSKVDDIGYTHALASTGICSLDYTKYDYIRPGAMLYGLKTDRCNHDIRSSVKFKTYIANIIQAKKGEGVAYEKDCILNRDTTIAVLPVGYADGLSKNWSKKGYVMIGKQKAPILTTICMDQMMIDITDLSCKISLGDEVILIDSMNTPNLEEISSTTGQARNEVMTSIARRVPKIYIKNNEIVKVSDLI